LLRVIQEKEITPVGSDQNIKTDVRIIASTNKDLKKMSDQGTFRQDLYFRLNVVSIDIPPLRDRDEDIPNLALHFLQVFSKKNNRDIKGFIPEAMDALIRYEWEGNVRELMNSVERAVVLARSDYITLDDFSFIKTGDMDQIVTSTSLENIKLSQIEEKAILSTLESAQGNKSEAARRLGITRKTLLKKLKQYGKV